jgi:transcriptional regulator with PAS, ATPase and Fis domain
VTSQETLGAELFGYAPRSGFANAPPGGRPGAAELADGGTLFIDEIGCLPVELQQKLLALIQTGTYSRLGSSERRQVDVQVIAATNEDLRELVRRRRFREDLLWRLSVFVVELPPLNERAADIPHLARRFLLGAAEQFERREIRGLKDRALSALLHHDWSRSGNVRGLEHTISRSVLLAPPGVRELDAEHLCFQSLLHSERRAARDEPHGQSPAPRPRRPAASLPELSAIQAAIREHGYATAAAQSLGISRPTLIWQLRKAGLSVRDVLLGSSGAADPAAPPSAIPKDQSSG